MFSDFEYQSRRGWGHSPVSAAVAVAEAARVGQLALFHHSPDATDAEIDALADEAQGRTSIKVFGASENHPIEL
jgi:ribonuclease BN (tRNA processing enzyme)